MNKTIYTLFLFLLINTCLFSQASVNYMPNSLQRELKKNNISSTQLTELKNSEVSNSSYKSGKYYLISNSLTQMKYVYIGRVNSCRAGGCSVSKNSSSDSNSEFFDYFIFFDNAAVIQLVKVFSYQATYGQEITAMSWLKQFKNYDGKSQLTVGDNVDAISGATISVDAIAADIEYVTKKLRLNIQ